MELDTKGLKIESQYNEYNVDIRERLHSAAPRDVDELLTTVREIGKELDKKMSGAMEELAIIDEELPLKLQTLKDFKSDLLGMRKKMKSVQKEYKSHCEEVLYIVKQNAPDLIQKLEDLSRKQHELSRLKAVLKGDHLLDSCNRSLSDDTSCLLALFRDVIAHQLTLKSIDEIAAEEYGEKVDQLSNKIQIRALSLLSNTLDSIRFPFDESVDHRAIINEREETTRVLWLVRLSAEREDDESGCSSAVTALFSCFEKRFRFHFSGDRKTNDVMKPEWYFAQLSSWLQHSLSFFELALRDVLTGSTLHSADEFVHRISGLANVKTKELLETETIRDNTLAFSHLIDEVVQFENTRKAYDVSSRGPSAFLPFCDDDVISRWVGLEQTVCGARVDELLQSEERWHARFRDLQEVDVYRVCECADAMVGLLDDLMKRAGMLPIEAARKRLVSVVVLLVDDFRTRLAHIARTADRPTMEPFPHVMNASWYLATVFEEWSENCGITPQMERTEALEQSAKMYRYMWTQMCSEMVLSLRNQIESLLLEYRNQNWQQIIFETEDVTAQMIPILMTLRSSIAHTGEVLSPVSFPLVFARICKEISLAFMEDVILCNRFSLSGATKMMSDVTLYFIPVLKSLAVRFDCVGKSHDWEQPLTPLVSALRLLSLPLWECHALSQSLHSLPDDIIEEKLLGMQMIGIDKEKALKLILLRKDMIDRPIKM